MILSTKNQRRFFLKQKKKEERNRRFARRRRTKQNSLLLFFRIKGYGQFAWWVVRSLFCACVCVINCSRVGMMIIFLLLGSRLCSLPRKKKISIDEAYHQSIGFSKEPISSLNRETSMSVHASLPKFSSGEVTKEYSMAD